MEDASPRYMGVNDDLKVKLTISNVEEKITMHTVQIHPAKPEMGSRVIRRSNSIWVDQIDAVTYKEGEEVTFLRWGIIKIDKITKADDGKTVLSMSGTYDPTATHYNKTKKATWLADTPDNVICTVMEYDHLISKAKLGEDDKFSDFINPNSKVPLFV